MMDAAKILEMIEKSGNGMVSTAQVEHAGKSLKRFLLEVLRTRVQEIITTFIF